MDFLNYMDGEVMESMQGIVGFKSYIPQSRDLHKFFSIWIKQYDGRNPLMEVKDINAYAIWAHDAVSALAISVERMQAGKSKYLGTGDSSQKGTTLLNQMLRMSFHGLGGVFQFRNRRITAHVLEIINVVGKGEQRVGFWTTDVSFPKKIGKLNSFSNDSLKAIIWPGGITSDSKRLTDKNLRIVVPAHSRSKRLFQVNYDARTNSTIVSGFCAEVFLAAFAALGQDVAFHFIPIMNNTKVGEIDYDDLIDLVHSGEFDAAIGDITISANRSLYVDFTLPYTDLGLATLSRKADASMWIFMEPLSSNLWLVSACFFILLAIVIWILEHRTNQEFQGSLGQQVGTTIWFAFSTLAYAHREKLQSNLSRFVVIVWLFVVLVLTSSYTATLSSLLTIQQIQLASNKNSVGYPYSILRGYIKNSFPGTKLKLYSTLEAYADALSRGSKKGGVDAIVDEIPYIKEFLAQYPSGYSMTVSEATTNGFGFVFARGSPWTPEISRQIARLREDGTLNKLENKWFNQEPVDSVPTTKVLSLKDLHGLFVISGVSMAAAVFLFMLYLAYEKLHFSYTMLAGGKLAFIMIIVFVFWAGHMYPDDMNLSDGYPATFDGKIELLYLLIHSKAQEDPSYKEIPVGVILDMGSWVGKTVHSCITISLSDFYMVNSPYKTRIVLHYRDTHGEPLHALSAALDLLKKKKVQAIIGSDSTSEAKVLAVLGDEARIPILSLSPTQLSHNHPYFLQIAHDESIQFKSIAAMAESIGWKNLIVVCEDTDNGRDMATLMINDFQEKSISVTYRSLISTSASNELVHEELHKLSTMQTKLFVVHTSPSLASVLFLKAKYLGMMDEGYRWIITTKTMDFLNYMDGEAMEAMQGTVGFKSYIPQSSDLEEFILKWREEYPLMEVKDINAYGIWAHDAVSALAMAVEKQVLKSSMKNLETTGSSQRGTALLNQMLRISFQGLGGSFQFRNGRINAQVVEIINVIGKGEKRVGFWTTDAAFTKKIGKLNSFFDQGLEAIIWPGGIRSNPRHRMLQMSSSKKLRIGIPVQSRSGRLFNVTHDPETNSTAVSGFCFDVFEASVRASGHALPFQFVPFMVNAEVGTVNYNDLIDQVHAGVFDVAIGDITITANRSLYVDFTLPYTDLGLATLSRNLDASMWIFMEPLSSDLWVVSGCFFILLGSVIWIFEHRTNEEFQGSLAQQIGTTFWFAFSTLVYAHREKLQSNLSRFVVSVWMFVVLVLTSSYIATLSSLLTVEQIQLASKENSIGYHYGSPIHGVIARNLNFEDTRLKRYSTSEEYADALALGSKKGGVDAIVDEIPYIKEFLSQYPSGYSMVDSEAITSGFGFAFPPGSPLAPEISRQITRLREDGTLKMLEERWFNYQQQSGKDSKDSAPRTKILNLEGLRGLFVISGVSMAAALFLFMLHLVHEKMHFTYTMLAGGKLAFITRFLMPKTTRNVVEMK
ncbi:hypothetical protein OSB04_003173 [Centaurea solstitialis]|uniref:Ionotropic glutamate receptor C-terminal domain-containing protein n=1 Tax=Centaurea solstitialis TaxID=347529 RepID=A0AA38UBN9_9ASTR|nr:hypothetical protein OSB04_003173 [Centaurea solstitialis]